MIFPGHVPSILTGTQQLIILPAKTKALLDKWLRKDLHAGVRLGVAQGDTHVVDRQKLLEVVHLEKAIWYPTCRCNCESVIAKIKKLEATVMLANSLHGCGMLKRV